MLCRRPLLIFASCLGLFACERSRTDDPTDPNTPQEFPVIERFDADRMVVKPGEAVTLSYKVAKTERARIDPGALAETSRLEGSVTTAPLSTSTSYTLIATSPVGETRRTLAITVRTSTGVEISEFTATPSIVSPGGSVTLSWRTVDATRVQLAVAGGEVLSGAAPAVGMQVVQPTANTTYVLVAEGPGGPVTREAVVLVGVPPVIRRFSASPAQITGGSSTLDWLVENASSITLRVAGGQVLLPNAPAQGSRMVSPTTTTEYELVASSPAGDAVSRTRVEVLQLGSPRVLSFTANPTSLSGPGDVMLQWSTADAETIDLRANGASVIGFPRTAMGQMRLGLSVDTRLELVVENPVGTSSSELVITVGAPDTTPPLITHTAVPSGQPEGVEIAVNAVIADAETGVASGSLFFRTQGQGAFQSLPLMPAGNDRYTATIPAAAVQPPALEYYLFAADQAAPANNASDPPLAPGAFHTVSVTPIDTAPPMISHTALTTDRPEGVAVAVSADVTDATGVDSVLLFYKRRSDALYTSVAMSAAGATYTAPIPAAAVVPPGVDYYLQASDRAQPANVARSPAAAPASAHGFTVIAADVSGPTLVHTPIANGQPASTAVTVSADVSDPSGVGSATLFYRRMGDASFTSAAMSGAGALRSASIPAAVVTPPGVEYYLEAVDLAAPPNTARSPGGAPAVWHGFSVTPADTAPPTIVHTPLPDGQAPGQPVTVLATVTDGSGVSGVTLYYRTLGGGGAYTSVAMSGGPAYSGVIQGPAVTAAGVEYYVSAVDTAANTAVLPATAPATGFSFRTGTAENEPNNSTAQGVVLLGPGLLTNIGLGAITPVADRDYWLIDVPSGNIRYSLVVEVTSGGVATCPAPTATRLVLYATDGTTTLVSDTVDGTGNCSRIDAAGDTGARALAAGRYFLAIEEDGNNAAIARYELRGTLSPTACGNNILESPAGEQCDDGNTMGGDGCSATCALEPEGTATAPGASFSGAISPAGDTDLFAVVMGAGQFLRAETSNGAGGCPGDTMLELYAPDGVTLLGSDDDDGSGLCSRIDPLTDAFVRNMGAGTYLLRVRALNAGTTIAAYTLDVAITNNVCGNSTLEGGETCDDGNTISFDGCSATCQTELAGTVSGMSGSFTEAISPAGNRDFYQLTVPEGAGVRAETFAPTSGMCAAGNDTVVRLYRADRTTQVTSDDDSGMGSCSLIDPATNVQARALAAGTYYVTVEDWQNDGTIAAYVVNISVVLPACGDGWVGGSESCDDGNTAAGDGCSAACQWEGPAEAEPNNTTGTANTLLSAGNLEGSVWGVLGSGTDVDVYSIVAPAGVQILAEVTDGRGGCNMSQAVRVRSSGGTSIANDSADGPGSCGRVSPGGDSGARSLTAGTYYVEVTGTGGVYQLHVRLMPVGCGDLYLVAGETCDDGNVTAGDGCSAACGLELMEIEPNNSSTTATALSGASAFIGGRIAVAGERDWYSIVVPAGGSILAQAHNGGPDQCGSIDPDIEVFGPDGVTSLAQDDLDGQGNCAALYRYELWNLPGGTYFIRVDAFSATATFDYVMSASVY